MFSVVLQQLVVQAPTLLVCLVAFVLSIVFMGRATLPSILTLVGIAVIAVGIFLQLGMTYSLIQNGQPGLTYALSISTSIVRAVGLGFLVSAVFVGRRITTPQF